LLNKDSDDVPLSLWIILCFLDDVADHSKIYEEPSDGGIQTPFDYQGLHEKHTPANTSQGAALLSK
jgi:hypothetical protein